MSYDEDEKEKQITPTVTLLGITAVYTQGATVYPSTPLLSLKTNLTVTAHYDDGTNPVLEASDYSLSGALTAGACTITVNFDGQTDTFSVDVSNATLTSITAVYTQGATVVYPTTSLDSLKTNLNVTAHYDDGNSQNTTAYTLSGTLSVGSSTINVNYGGLATTFNVTVTAVAIISISAEFNQGSLIVITTTPLNDLRDYLTVKATYNDGSITTIPSGYSLSGTLTVGTSSITVDLAGISTTFNVNVLATYTVTFNSNGGSGSMGSDTFTQGVAKNLSNNSFTKNYTFTGTTETTQLIFTGWNTQADGNGYSYSNNQNVTLTGNITLYAQWTPVGVTGPGGGIIFYFNSSGFTVQMLNPLENYTAHYLEVAPTNISISLTWCNCVFGQGCRLSSVTDMTDVLSSAIGTGTTIPNETQWAAINADIGNGRKNTYLIANCTNHSDNTASNNAAKAVLAENTGVINDWFLPSIGELYWLYYNRTQANHGIATSFFWSSSQGSINNLWCVSFINGSRGFGQNSSAGFVRAIRAF